MPTPKSEWRKAGDRILAEGPADRQFLLSAMAESVPPNRASAATMSNRRWLANYRGHSATSTGDVYSAGARRLATDALRAALQRRAWVELPDGRIALRGADNRTEVEA